MTTFDFSGDLQWASWRRGIECATESCHAANIEAIGMAITYRGDRIEARPVCETCATDRNVLLFEEEDD